MITSHKREYKNLKKMRQKLETSKRVLMNRINCRKKHPSGGLWNAVNNICPKQKPVALNFFQHLL